MIIMQSMHIGSRTTITLSDGTIKYNAINSTVPYIYHCVNGSVSMTLTHNSTYSINCGITPQNASATSQNF